MKKNTNKKILTNLNDIKFQVIDWDFYHEQEDISDIEINKYTIRLYGKTEENKNIYVRIDDFSPYFFVEIPTFWKDRHIRIFIDTIIHSVPFKLRSSLKKWEIVNKHKFWGFTNNTIFKFIIFIFYGFDGFKAFEKVFDREIRNRYLSKVPRKYKIYESNIPPFFRFMHIRQLKAFGWIKIPAKKYNNFKNYEKPTHNEINIYTKWTNVFPLNKTDIAPLIIASYDIECTSGDGKSFPQEQNDEDKVIQIGTTFNKYGESHCFYKHIITLKSCDPIEGIDVESYETEREVLLAWQSLIIRMNPDIMTGYNIFGFDYKYLEARSRKLGCAFKFSKLGRLKNICSNFIIKKRSSAAMGVNKLYYYEMSGRIQVDLMKVIQSDSAIKLPSYKLDNVASNFIRGDIIKIINTCDRTIIETSNTFGLSVGRYIKIFYNDGLTDNFYEDGKKFKVTKIEENFIHINEFIDKNKFLDDQNDKNNQDNHDNNRNKLKFFWCQAKDDVKPKDIFAFQNGSSTDRAIIASYCVQDCELVSKLMEKLQILTNNIGMSNVCHVPLSYIFLRGQGIKIFSLVAKKCRLKNYLMPVLKKPFVKIIENPIKVNTKNEINKSVDTYEGATVLKPEIGVHFTPIAVLDYSSLYPRSMIHRNISHESLVMNKKYDNLPDYNYYDVKFYSKDNNGNYTIPEKARFAKKKDNSISIIPEILNDLLDARDKTRNQIKLTNDKFKQKILDGLQLAYKITANSLYGQTGTPTSPIYLKQVAASTSATGREMLNVARIFTEYIFPKIIFPILNNNYKLYHENINLMLNNQIDELLGKNIVKQLLNTHYKDNNDPKNNTHLLRDIDYYYLNIFKERTNLLTDSDFEDKKKEIRNRNDFIEYIFKQVLETLDGLTINPNCVYGDSVTSDTPILIKKDNNIYIKTIDNLNNEWKPYEGFKNNDSNRRKKQQNSDNIDFDVWSDNGWTKVKRVIRHKCKKKIYRILTNTGTVDVTEDHSLLNKNGLIIKPSECIIGSELLHYELPIINKKMDIKINSNKAYIYGFFMGDGYCGSYNTKYGKKYTWELNSTNYELQLDILNRLKKIYPENDFEILDIMSSCGVYKLIPKKKIKSMVIEYSKFYNKNKYKIIPNEILNSNKKIKVNFLEGFYVTDKSRKEQDKITSMSLFFLLKSIGYNVTINVKKNKGNEFELTYYNDKQKNPIKIKKIIDLGYTNDFVYDIETEHGRFNAGIGELVVKNTDSIFINFGITDKTTNKLLTNKQSLIIAIKIGILCGDLINIILPKPQCLEYEKTFWPFISLSKKRYVGNLYEINPDVYYQKSMGIVLKRRDNAPIVKIVVGGIVDKILNKRSAKKAVEFTKNEIQKIFSGKYPIDKFIISKTIKGGGLTKEERISEQSKPKEEKFYVDRNSIPHAVLADRIADRDPGNKPQSNDRIPFVYIRKYKKVKLQGERIEHPEYVIENNLEIDYLFYITNQIRKPAIQFLEKVVKNPDKIFDNFIIREINRRKGKKPLKYYLGTNKSELNEKSDSDNEFKINNLNVPNLKPNENIKKLKPKIKSKSKSKSKLINCEIDSPKYNKNKNGFTIDF